MEEKVKKIFAILIIFLLTACSASSKTTTEPTASSGSNPQQSTQSSSQCKISYPNDPGWGISFCTTMDDNPKGWDLSPLDNQYLSGDIKIENGIYTAALTGKAASNYLNAAMLSIPLGKATNFYVGVSGKITSIFKGSNWGIGFMADDNGHSFIHFALLKDSYSLSRHNKDAVISDQVIETKVTDQVEIGAMNSMELKRDGNWLYYYINGKSTGRYNLSELQYPGNNIYLFMIVNEGAKATFNIDNILLESK